MSQFPQGYQDARFRPLQYESAEGAVTVAQFFNVVYAWMATGLALTGVVAFTVASNAKAMSAIFNPVVMIALVIVELLLVGVISAAVKKINSAAATVLFLIYSALNGLTLSVIFLVYTHSSIASTFLVTAGSFAALSVYGFVTKRDLTGLGSLLFMALIGLVLASVVNIFLASSGLCWVITYAGVLIFVGLIAYDTQKLKELAMQTGGDREFSNRLAISGALILYLDFLNLFLMLLRLMGDRRNS